MTHNKELKEQLDRELVGWTIEDVEPLMDELFHLTLSREGRRKKVSIGATDLGMWLKKVVRLRPLQPPGEVKEPESQNIHLYLQGFLAEVENHICNGESCSFDTKIICADEPQNRLLGYHCTNCQQTWYITLTAVCESYQHPFAKLLHHSRTRELLAKKLSQDFEYKRTLPAEWLNYFNGDGPCPPLEG